MTSENLLQLGHSHYTSTWKNREETIWCHSIRNTILIAMLVACPIRILAQVKTEAASRSPFLISVFIVALAYCIFVYRQKNASVQRQKIMLMILMQVVQSYFACMAVLLFSDCVELWAVMSSILFCLFEISSFNESWMNVMLLGRQMGMWYLAGYLAKSDHTEFGFPPMLMLITTIVIAMFAVRETRNRAIEYYRFCDSIEEQESKMASILQAIPEGLAVITSTLSLPCVNSRFQSILQPTEGSYIARLSNLYCTKTEEGSSLAMPILAQIQIFLSDPKSECETFGASLLGGKFYEWKGTKCIWGESTACILTASDISSWVSAQTKLLQESNSKTVVLRFVSHELRTPTNAILNLATNVMSAANILPEQFTELSIVVTSTHFLLSVVNDLLDFTRIVADKFTLVKQSFDIRHEIRETVSLLELQCAHKGLYLMVKFDELIPEIIYSDPNRLKQVVLNLLGNALKFTFQGGIRVICMLTDRNTMKVSVKDTGIGIPKDKITGLCQAFGTVEGTQRINPQGCGLGLYISNLLALSLGSYPIDINTKLGVGSEFSFQVNIFQKEPTNEIGVFDYTTEIEDEREKEAVVSGPGISGGKSSYGRLLSDILIVDDSDFNRVVLAKLLESFHLQADQSNSGLQALAMIRANLRRGHCYRMIIMDVEMPEMDGIIATREIRAMELNGELQKRPRIVACSAHRGREDVDRCLEAGMDDYLEKPISRTKLQELMAGFFSVGVRMI